MTLERGYLVARKSSSCVSVWEERTSFVEMKKYIFQSYPVCHLQQIGRVSACSTRRPRLHTSKSKLLLLSYTQETTSNAKLLDLVAWTLTRALAAALERPSVFKTGKHLKPSDRAGETRETDRMRENQSIVRVSRISVAWMRGNQPFPQSVYLVGWFW
jgi:hypothetical protein